MIEFRLNLPFTYLCTHCLCVCVCVCLCVCIHTYLFFFSFVCSLDENSTRRGRRGQGNRSWGVCGRLCDRQAGASLSLSHSFNCCSFTNTHRHTPVCSLFVCFACRVLLFMVLLPCCCCRSCCFCCCPVAVLLLGA